MGPMKTELVLRRLCIVLIPPGTGDPLSAALHGISLLAQTGNTFVTDSIKWVDDRLELIRQCRDPNPWKNADDEAICTELLKRVAAKNVFDERASNKLRKLIAEHGK
jgi:hypothetical protein